ncbi:MAG: DUF3090 family protein [Actinomycetota bacterium]|nr:DUF3090 family protein [Actinomycetota bacterium]MDH5224694.1 DUF3090 family protein [Actinomycetota bacterium]MDH5314715.1 DUF3090 family protein [Actinomycetota bacterium]
MDLGLVDRITAGTIGEPGQRTFFLQARSGGELVTIVVEKQQVQLLSASILELLADLELETGVGPSDDELRLEEPIDPMFRAGKLSIGYDDGRELFVLEIEEFIPEVEGEEALTAPEGEPDNVQLAATREQMFALSRYAAAVVERGRPTCQFCGNPIDTGGHACPAMNGHSKRN